MPSLSEPYKALYVDPSRIKRDALARSLRMAGRDVMFACSEPAKALAALGREQPDVLVVYVLGWRNKQEFEHLVQSAEARGIPVLRVLRDESMANLELDLDILKGCVLYSDALDLAEKVRQKMEEKGDG